MFALLVLVSFFSAGLSAVLGMAGGLTLLLIMTPLLPASAVIPLHGTVQLAANAVRTIAYLRYVHWPIFWRFVVSVTVGMGAAATIWQQPSCWLDPAIGGFVLITLLLRRFSGRIKNAPLSVFFPLGFVVGFLSLFVGASGPLAAPFFLRDDFEKERVIATGAVSNAWLHFAKIPAFLSIGFEFGPYSELLGAMILAGIPGTFAGKALLHRIPEQLFLRFFEWFLAVMGVYLLASGARQCL